jgi:hypothetical protein
VRSSKPLLVPSGVSSSIPDPDADDDSGVPGPVFEFVQQQQQPQVRRSQRVPRPRDLGPAIRH